MISITARLGLELAMLAMVLAGSIPAEAQDYDETCVNEDGYLYYDCEELDDDDICYDGNDPYICGEEADEDDYCYDEDGDFAYIDDGDDDECYDEDGDLVYDDDDDDDDNDGVLDDDD